jgi:hypothetical protein
MLADCIRRLNDAGAAFRVNFLMSVNYRRQQSVYVDAVCYQLQWGLVMAVSCDLAAALFGVACLSENATADVAVLGRAHHGTHAAGCIISHSAEQAPGRVASETLLAAGSPRILHL